jgi:tRNA U34 5-carboxymethylaminomethyl modifying enzyme MnmG/GidA
LLGDINYFGIPLLSNELKCKLDAVWRFSIVQPRRIAWMTKATLVALLIYLEKEERELTASAQAISLSRK